MNHRQPIVITIGVFDGVHKGHQALIRETVRWAKRLKAVPVAVTFQDHPMHVVHGQTRIPFLLRREETFRLLKSHGLKRVVAVRFTKAFSSKSPPQFVDWLQAQGHIQGIVVGENFRFGQGAKGDVRLLRQLGRQGGFKVAALRPVRVGGRVVSSSLIRGLLMAGKLVEANRLLGRPYAIAGQVVHGKHVGHKIGFPTANLGTIGEFLPRDGVYACAVPLGRKLYRAGMNLGKRPTFKDDKHHRQAEVHLLRYYGKLYGRHMRVYLLDYLRPEKKFASSKALVAQIRKDLKRVQRASFRGVPKA